MIQTLISIYGMHKWYNILDDFYESTHYRTYHETPLLQGPDLV